MSRNYSYKIKGKSGENMVVNNINIVTELNGIKEILEGSGSGGLSNSQLKQVNDKITDLTQKLNDLITDVDKYIDETELNNSLKVIKETLTKVVNINDFQTKINDITTNLSTLSNKITTLENNISSVPTDYYTKAETVSKIKEELIKELNKLETTWKANIKNDILTDLNITQLKKDVKDIAKTEVENKLNEKANDIKTEINNGVDTKLGDYVSKSSYNSDKNTFVYTNKENVINKKTTFKANTITNGIENVGDLESNSVDSAIYKLQGNNILLVDSNGDYSFGHADKTINVITKGKLKVNGQEINTNNYELPNNVVKKDVENIFTAKQNFNNGFSFKGFLDLDRGITISNGTPQTIIYVDTSTPSEKNLVFDGRNFTNTYIYGSNLRLQGNKIFFNNREIDPNKLVTTDNLTNYVTQSDLGNYVQSTQLNNYVRKETLTNDYINKATLESNYLKKTEFTLPTSLVYTDRLNNFSIQPKFNNENLATENYVNNKLNVEKTFNEWERLNSGKTVTDYFNSLVKKSMENVFVTISEEDYNNLTVKDPNKIYLIQGE